MVKKLFHLVQKVIAIFTRHKDEERKRNYIARHKVNQNWNDYNTAGFWAKNILWNKSTIEESIKDTDRKFKNLKMKIIFSFIKKYIENYFLKFVLKKYYYIYYSNIWNKQH